MPLLETVKNDLRAALLKRDRSKVETLRFLLAAVQNLQIEKRGDLKEDEILGVILAQAKNRRESIAAFEKGNRPDLAEKERNELQILSGYLPQPLTQEELKRFIREACGGTRPTGGMKDMGKLMGAVMPLVRGRSSGEEISMLARSYLEGKWD